MSGKDEVGDPIWIFSFNTSAIDGLELLDPREAVQVNLLPRRAGQGADTEDHHLRAGRFSRRRCILDDPRTEEAPVQTAAVAAH